ncbi:DUF1453 domain-containing protein [Streptomyces sp. NPDC056411]|uniref:DUF1453 domain-containing protein n=1 Tax=Streptomyces sp. NPDC056411 TaxID=3345813 RepID=UPI0035D6DA73
MSGLLNIVVIAAVVIWVFARQFKAQRVAADGRRWWLLPAVLVFLALRQPGLLDAEHPAVSAALLSAELLTGLACGAGWAWTMRIWTGTDGAVWTKGSWAAAGVWLGGMAVRGGLAVFAGGLGVHLGGAALMLGVAAMLLARSGVTVWRSRGIQQPYRVPVAG